MRPSNHARRALGFALAGLGACADKNLLDEACGTPSTLTNASVQVSVPSNTVLGPMGTVTLQGSIDSPGRRSIRRVTVLGLDATASGENFRTWSVAVDAARLFALRASSAGDQAVAVPVNIYDACATDEAMPTVTTTVSIVTRQDDNHRLTRLRFVDLGTEGAAVSPRAAFELPATAQATLRLALCANPEAAETVLRVSTSDGTLTPTGGSVTLSAPTGTDPASVACGGSDSFASLLFRPGARADTRAVLAASGGLVTATQAVTSVAPPAFSSAAVSLDVDQSVPVTLSSFGTLQGCRIVSRQPASSTGLSATLDGTSVSEGGMPTPVRVAGSTATLTVQRANSANPSATLVLRCFDTLGQSSDLVVQSSASTARRVTELNLTVAPPAAVPADNRSLLVVTVDANPEAAGVALRFDASPGGVVDGSPILTLGPMGLRSTFTGYFHSDVPGVGILTVTAGDRSDRQQVLVASAPVFGPVASATVINGNTLSAVVDAPAGLQSCTLITDSDALTVSVAGARLRFGTPVMLTGRPTHVSVSVHATAASGSSVLVRCADTLNQEGTAIYTPGP